MISKMPIQQTQLHNQLMIATETVPFVDSVVMGVWFKVGGRYENAQQIGMAHFLEHMAFKGTTTRSAKDLAEFIEGVGGYMNAHTGKESTAFYTKVLAADAERAMAFLSDILLNPVFDAAEMDKERQVILQELGAVLDTPEDWVFDLFYESAFPGQSLGQSILGTPQSLASMRRDDLVEFFKQSYTPSQAVLVAVGNIEHDTVVEWAQRYFSSWGDPNQPSQAEKITIQPATFVDTTRGSNIRHVEQSCEQLHLVLGASGVSMFDDDYYDMVCFSTLLGGGMSSHLFQEIRENLGLVYSIYAFHSSFQDTGLLGIYAGTHPDHQQDVLTAIDRQVQRIAVDSGSDPFHMAALERVKRQLSAGLVMEQENLLTRAESLAHNLLFFHRPISVSEHLEKIARVDDASIQSIAARLAATPWLQISLGTQQRP